MFDNDVRQILALSAQADRLGDQLTRKRITTEEYNRKLADLRRQCDFQVVELDSATCGS